MREKMRNSGIDKKRADEAPGQIRECPNMKFVNNLSPSRTTENLELVDLIDVQTIRPLMDDFYKLVHTPIGINDLKGNVLVGVGWQDICTKFHRVHPEACKHCIESDTKLSASVFAGEFKLYKCKNNMWDMATPIIVGGQHVGYVFSGQFFFEDEPLDYELFRSQAKQYGFNEEEYIAALKKVPRLSRESVDTAMSFLMTFTNMVSQLGYRNLKLAQSLEERDSLVNELQESEKALEKAYNVMEEKVKERTAELQNAYNSLKESERSLAEAQKMAHIGNWDWNLVTGEVCWSDELYRIFGRSPKEPGATYDEFLSYVYPDDRDRVNNAIKKGLSGEPVAGDYRIILANGEERIVHTEVEFVFYERNNPIQVKGTVQDITERKKAEEKIQYLANIVESSKDAIVTVSLNGIVTSWNKGAEQIFGYAPEEILGKKVSILEPDNLRGEIKQLIEMVKQGEKVKHYETSRLKKDGTIIIVSGTLSPVLDTSRKLVAISVIVRDITERKKAEEAMVNIEIARKKEIHHRIKNNLQVISSLLDLQAEKFSDREYVKNSEIIEAFRESQDRVTSIALIHEELHEEEGTTDTLNFSLYLHRLTESLFQTYRFGNVEIYLNLGLEENIFFGMDTAVPLGMIVNELVSNSLKYAFSGKKTGEIRIKLFSTEITSELNRKEELTQKNTKYTLIVSDNGTGIPKNIDFENSDTLGLQLVNLLVDQLDGTIELKRDNGAEFTIRFNNIEA